MTGPLTGGCQCGAVRFRVDGPVRQASLCHCRMCQKATGAPFGAYGSVAATSLTWTRGRPKLFRSSEHIGRGFCADCGTPLTFEAASGDGRNVGLTLGAFDRPAEVTPEQQIMVGERIPWVDAIADLPQRSVQEEAAAAARYPPVVSRQHPDHDTDTWPPER